MIILSDSSWTKIKDGKIFYFQAYDNYLIQAWISRGDDLPFRLFSTTMEY